MLLFVIEKFNLIPVKKGSSDFLRTKKGTLIRITHFLVKILNELSVSYLVFSFS